MKGIITIRKELPQALESLVGGRSSHLKFAKVWKEGARMR
jgi:hypothetical protein